MWTGRTTVSTEILEAHLANDHAERAEVMELSDLKQFAEALKSFSETATIFENFDKQPEEERAFFAYALRGLRVDLSECAASYYRIGRVLENMHELTKDTLRP